MTDERYTFEQARLRLEEIAVEVRKKDVSLEKSLDLLEEGVRLANICTELVDHTDLSATVMAADAGADPAGVSEAAIDAPDDDVVGEGAGAATAAVDRSPGSSHEAGESDTAPGSEAADGLAGATGVPSET